MKVVRDLRISDLVELEQRAQFPIDFLREKPKIVQMTFEDDKGVIGSVFATGTVELTAIFGDRSDREKIEVMKCIPDILYKQLHPRGYRDIHTFIKDPKFADILVKHFNFEDIVGRGLVRRY